MSGQDTALVVLAAIVAVPLIAVGLFFAFVAIERYDRRGR